MIDQYNQVNKLCHTIDRLFDQWKDKEIIPKNFKQFSLGKEFTINIIELEFNHKKLLTPLAIKSGDRMILYGDSGVGKTTLFNILKDIIPADNILIQVNQQQFFNCQRLESNFMLAKGDSFRYFHSKLSHFLTDDLPYDEYWVNYLLNLMKMDDFIPKLSLIVNSRHLSEGQKKRLSLIKILYQTIILEYPLLLLDEPDDGLQESLFLEIIQNIFIHPIFHDKAIILISHNPRIQSNNRLFNATIQVTDEEIIFHRRYRLE
jgi:ABC-type bacteriocin/lantibiotic exporter with double-glycine peptidase domain